MTTGTDYRIYVWTGTNKHGVETKGVLPAENISLAESQLHGQGVEIYTLKEKSKFMAMGMLKSISPSDIAIFARQVSTMVSAGIPLVQSLEIVGSGIEKLSMRAMIMTVHRDVAAGNTLTEALQKHQRHFSHLVCNLIGAGEESGTLDTVLDQIATYLERIQVLKGRIKKAMFYPVMMLVVTTAVAVLLLGFIVPQFAGLFKSFGAELPGPTQVVIALSNGLQHYWWLLLGLLGGSIFGFIYLKRHSQGFREFLDRLTLKLIIFGPLIQKAILARITRTLSITLAAGIPLVDALRSVAGVAGNSVYSDAVLRVRDDVTAGKQISVSMGATEKFPSIMLQMVGVGEKAGALESMFSKLADYFDEQVSTMVDALSTLIEPIMLVLLGLVIGGFVISMYLPIFRLGTVM